MMRSAVMADNGGSGGDGGDEDDGRTAPTTGRWRRSGCGGMAATDCARANSGGYVWMDDDDNSTQQRCEFNEFEVSNTGAPE